MAQRQLLALGAVRAGLRGPHGLPDDRWRPIWATGADMDPRLLNVLDTGPVETIELMGVGESLLVSVIGSRSEEMASLSMWDAIEGRRLWDKPIKGYAQTFTVLDGKPLVVADTRFGGIDFFDALTGEHVAPRLAIRSWVNDQVRLCEGRPPVLVVVDEDGEVSRWDPTTGSLLGDLCPDQFCTAIDVGKLDGQPIVVTGHKGHYSVWDAVTGRALAPQIVHPGSVYGLAVCEFAGTTVAVTSNESGEVHVHSVLDGEPFASPYLDLINVFPRAVTGVWRTLDSPPSLAGVDGIVAVPGRTNIHLWRPGSADDVLRPLRGATGRSVLSAVAWRRSPMLASASPHGDVVRLWDLSEYTEPSVAAGHRFPVKDVTVGRGVDEPIVVSFDKGCILNRRRLKDGVAVGEPIRTFHAHSTAVAAIVGVVFTAGGDSSYPDTRIGRWGLSGGARLEPLDGLPIRHLLMEGMALPERSLVAAVGGRGQAAAWDADAGHVVWSTGPISDGWQTGAAICPHPEHPLVAMSMPNGTIVALDLRDGKTLSRLPGRDDDAVLAVFATVGRHLAVIGRPTEARRDDDSAFTDLRLLDLAAGKVLPTRFPNHVAISAVAAVGDDHKPNLAIAYTDASVWLCDIETGSALGPPLLLPEPSTRMRCVDDRNLLVAYGCDLALFQPPVCE